MALTRSFLLACLTERALFLPGCKAIEQPAGRPLQPSMSGGNSRIFGAFSSPKRMRNRHSFENDRKAADHLRRCCRIARPDISLRSKGELSKRVLLARPHQQTMLGNLNIAIYLFLDRCRTPSRHPQQRAILPFRRIEANPGLPAAQTSLRGRPLVRRHRGPTRPAGARGISGHH